MNGRGSITRQTSCALCRHMRKKCPEGKCPFAPYFPAKNTREVQSIHRVFGIKNTMKMVLEVDEAYRRPLVESLVREAFMRDKDPVLGIYREYATAWNELFHLKDLVHANSTQIRQLQSQIIRMKGYDNGNNNSIIPVSSGHIEWRYQNYPQANLGVNNNPMTCTRGSETWMMEGIPVTGNMQNRLYIKNDNKEQAVASSSSSTVPLPLESHGR